MSIDPPQADRIIGILWGLLKDAWQLLLKGNPFPAVCGRVCFHPCENACKRDKIKRIENLGVKIHCGNPVVFGGDLTSPVKSVADAIASGKQAAMALNTYYEKGLEAVDAILAACRVGPGPALSMEAYSGGNRQDRNPHVTDADYQRIQQMTNAEWKLLLRKAGLEFCH